MGKGKRRMLHHDDIVKALAQRLREKGHLETITTHEFYATGRYNGEVDVLARTANRVRFYEVKSRDSDRAYSHACDQYWRFCKAFPELDVAGIYVTSTCVQRIPPYHKSHPHRSKFVPGN